MARVTKVELIARLSDITGLSKRNTESLVDSFVGIIHEVIVNGDILCIKGVGRIETYNCKGRNREEAFGKKIIPSKPYTRVRFRPSKKLLKELRG